MLDIPVSVQEFGGTLMGFFPYEGYSNAGALVQHPDQAAVRTGNTMVYFNCSEDPLPTLGRVENAGGKVLMPKSEIGENMGFFACFTRHRGNRVGLYSDK